MMRRIFPDGFPAAEPSPSGPWRNGLIAAIGLAVVLVLLYLPAVDFRLLSFDDQYYTRNDFVSGGLKGRNIVRIFTELPEENLFIPLTWLSLMADVELYGNSSRGFHLTSILLFATGMALLLLLLWRMTGRLGPSAFAAALVALHPLRVESVAWVTERKSVLSVLFLILSVACHMRYVRTGKGRWYIALFFCVALGMLAKPILVTLPFMLLLLDFWPLGRFRPGEGAAEDTTFPWKRLTRLVVEKVPFAILSLLASVATVHLQQKMSLHAGEPLLARMEHSFVSFFFYLYQSAWPLDLPFRYFDTVWAGFSGTFLPATAGLVVVTAAITRYAAARPYLLFGWVWYLISLFPVSGIVPSGIQWVSDRFTFVPHIGLFVAFAWGASDLFSRRSRWIFPAVGLLILLPLTILTRQQLFFWKDGASLFRRGLPANAQDPRFITQYAEELVTVGDFASAREQMDRIRPFALDPVFGVNIQLNRLSLLERLGMRKDAIGEARAFLEKDPRFWKTRILLSDLLYADGRFPEAASEYRQVLEVKPIPSPDRAYALEGLGLSLWRTGREEEALACYLEALRAAPASVSIRYNTARLFAGMGKREEARMWYEDTLRLAPGNARVRLALADLLVESGAIRDAVFQFQEVVRLLPGSAEELLAKGRVLEAAGGGAEARPLYEASLKAPPVYPETAHAVRLRLESLP
jgi:tetratricopeptide (TPR) repeat protein